jgi:hypothetical protein
LSKQHRPLFDFVHSPEILGPFVDAYKCGWFDGGCFVFARSLQLWLGGQLAVIVRPELYDEQTFDHCLLSCSDPSATAGRLYIDANGVSNSNDLLQYWRSFENISNPILEDPVDQLRLVSHLEEEAWSSWLAQTLNAEFGKPKAENLVRTLGTVALLA